jgi:hypothetical protein
MGGFHPLTIVADGKTAGSVRQGERAESPAGPGRHAVRLEPPGLMRSSDRSSGVAGGQVAGFSCRSPRFVKPGLWISLRRE